MDVPFHRWTFGFREFTFSRSAQALQNRSIHVFCCVPLSQQALVPVPFRVEVSWSPRSLCPELRPSLMVIVLVRTMAHSFLARRSPVLPTVSGESSSSYGRSASRAPPC